jgi:predicted phage terminase large subunit-like protein
VTTTPRPTPLIRQLATASTTHLTRESTYANRGHLAPAFLQEIEKRYGQTRIGLVVVGLGADRHVYVLDDRSGRYTPAEWAKRAVDAFHNHRADRIVAEINQGGALVEANLRTVDPRVPYKAVRASRGKAIRAEPVAALYEQGRVHHVGCLATLEDQMVSWDPTTADTSPDRLDAVVWGITELAI